MQLPGYTWSSLALVANDDLVVDNGERLAMAYFVPSLAAMGISIILVPH
jgi:hypothetical protein